jgi:hypothetical protein
MSNPKPGPLEPKFLTPNIYQEGLRQQLPFEKQAIE